MLRVLIRAACLGAAVGAWLFGTAPLLVDCVPRYDVQHWPMIASCSRLVRELVQKFVEVLEWSLAGAKFGMAAGVLWFAGYMLATRLKGGRRVDGSPSPGSDRTARR